MTPDALQPPLPSTIDSPVSPDASVTPVTQSIPVPPTMERVIHDLADFREQQIANFIRDLDRDHRTRPS